MRRFIFIFTLLAFTITGVSAGAFACPKPLQDTGMSMEMDADMPCHEETQSNDHCEDICLCQHMSINQSFTLQNAALPAMMHKIETRISAFDIAFYSNVISPPEHPPKTLS